MPSSLALKHRPTRSNVEDCLAHSHTPLTWLITPGHMEQRLTVPEMMLRVTTSYGAVEPARRHQQTAVTDQIGAAGQSLHLSFGSSATSKLGVVVVAWGGLWTCWLRSYYTK